MFTPLTTDNTQEYVAEMSRSCENLLSDIEEDRIGSIIEIN